MKEKPQQYLSKDYKLQDYKWRATVILGRQIWPQYNCRPNDGLGKMPAAFKKANGRSKHASKGRIWL